MNEDLRIETDDNDDSVDLGEVNARFGNSGITAYRDENGRIMVQGIPGLDVPMTYRHALACARAIRAPQN